MVYCFAPDCRHSTDTHTCKFFIAPRKEDPEYKKWESLLRRSDRKLSRTSKVCECHFKDGLRINGPTIFKHNQKRCLENIQSPKKKVALNRNRKKLVKSPQNPEASILSINAAMDNEASTGNIEADQASTSKGEERSNTDASTSRTEGVTADSFNLQNLSIQLEDKCLEPDEEDIYVVNAKVHKENSKLKMENRILYKLLNAEKKEFSFEVLQSKPNIFEHYTGIAPHKFKAFFLYFDGITVNYFYKWSVTSLNRENQLLIFIMKLRHNFTYDDLAYRFNVSVGTIANIFLTWLHVVHKVFFIGVFCSNGIPSRHKNKQCLPLAFSDFPNCRIVLDCTEFRIEKPGALDLQRDTFSSYKSTNTFKALLGVAPNGCPTFASKLYPGSKSDKEVVRDSKVLDQMEVGDCILADKGFLISDLLPPGVALNMPPFLCTPQFTTDQILVGEKIACARTHVERAIKRIREYRILQIIPAQYRDYASLIWQTCVSLQLFNSPLIKAVEKKMKFNYDDVDQ